MISSYQQHRKKPIVHLQTGLIVLSFLLASSFAEKRYQSTCETIPNEIHITKGKYNTYKFSKP